MNIIDFVKETVQVIAVRRNASSIKDIDNPSERVQMEAVKKDAESIKYIANPCEKVQMEAVTNSLLYLEYIKEPCEKVQMEAVTNSLLNLEYIKEPCEEAWRFAVVKEPSLLFKIKNPTANVLRDVLTKVGVEVNSHMIITPAGVKGLLSHINCIKEQSVLDKQEVDRWEKQEINKAIDKFKSENFFVDESHLDYSHHETHTSESQAHHQQSFAKEETTTPNKTVEHDKTFSGGYGLQTFSVARQINSIAEKQM